MYIKDELTGIKCDNCKELYTETHNGFSFFSDELNAQESADNDGWFHNNKKHYCPNCHTIDDDDKLITKHIEMEQTSNINSTHHYGKPMLSEGLLIPMTEFVLNIDKLVPKDGDQFFGSWQNEKLIIIENYARFLNKPLELGMFFPCDIYGSRLNDVGLLPSQEQFIYRKAKEKVLFKAKPHFDEGAIKHHISQGRNVEYLANFGSMQLTQNAIDVIFG